MNVNTRVGDIKRRFEEVLHEVNANKTQFRKNTADLNKFVANNTQIGSSSCMNIQNDLSSRNSRSGSTFSVPVSNRSNIKRTPAFRCEKLAKPSRPSGQINNNNIVNKDVGKLCSDRMKQFESKDNSAFDSNSRNLRKASPQTSKFVTSVISSHQCALTDRNAKQQLSHKYHLQRNKSVGEIQLNNYGSISNSGINRKPYKTDSKSSINGSKLNINSTKESSRLVSSTGIYSAAPNVSNNIFSKADRLNSHSSKISTVPLPSVNVDPNRLNFNSSGHLSTDESCNSAVHSNFDTKSNAKNYPLNFLNKQSVKAVSKTTNSVESIDPTSLPSSVHAALRAPLPKGPPPKKPPRTFAHNLAQNQSVSSKIQNTSPNQLEPSKCIVSSSQNLSPSHRHDKFANLRPVRSKTESQIMLKKLENFLQSQHDISSLMPKRSREEADLDVGRKSLYLRKGPLPEVPSLNQGTDIPTTSVPNHILCLQSLNCATCTMSPNANIYEKLPISQSQFFVDFQQPGLETEVSRCRSQSKLQLKRSGIDDPVYAEVLSPKDLKSSNTSKLGVELGRTLSHSSSSPCIAPLSISASQSSLHYMSTPVKSVPHPLGNVLTHMKSEQSNFVNNHCSMLNPCKISSVDEIYGSSKMAPPDSLSKPMSDKIHLSFASNERNIQMLVNEAYSAPCWKKMSEVSSDSDSTASVSEDFKENFRDGEKEQLTRVRKGYVRRVATRALSQKRPTQFSSPNFSHLFECLLLIGLDLDPARCKVPYIKSKYPRDVTLPDKFEYLCFPDASDWPPPTPPDSVNQCYTVVITTELGQRKYGYCKRVQPEGAPICLPLAYCIITPYKANSFYYQLLVELESRHGQTDQNVMNFIKELYENSFPSPGQGVKVTPTTPSTIDQKFDKVEILKRPKDSRQDTDLTGMLSYLRLSIFVQLFSTLLHERKVILLSKFVSVLSMCIEGLQASLHPFQWPHTIAAVLSPSMQGFLDAPTPYIFGVLKSYHTSESCLPSLNNLDEVMVVDLDLGKIIKSVGDELSILPSRVAKGLKAALQINLPTDNNTRNLLISEALIRLFVELIGHYREFMFVNVDTQKKEFQREAFINCVESKSVRLFLDWFTETAMFQLFIESRLETGPDSRGIFEQRCAEFAEEKDRVKGKNYKGLNKTVKNIGDRLKDWATLS